MLLSQRTKKLLMDTAFPTHAISLETPDGRQLATEPLLLSLSPNASL